MKLFQTRSTGFAPISLLFLLLVLTGLTLATVWTNREPNLGTGVSASRPLNLVQNASFEDWYMSRPNSWLVESGFANQSGDASAGSSSVLLSGTLSQPIVGTMAGGTYELSFSAKGDAGAVKISFRKTDGTVQEVPVNIPSSASYINVSQTVNLPADVSSGSVKLSFTSAGNQGLYLDDVSLAAQ